MFPVNAFQKGGVCPGFNGFYELCDNLPNSCCPEFAPVCCPPTSIWPHGFCCSVSNVCGYNSCIIEPSGITVTAVPAATPELTTPATTKPTTASPTPKPPRGDCPTWGEYWELCDNMPNHWELCCPKDSPVCCPSHTSFWGDSFCCPVNYTCCGRKMCCNSNPNDPTQTPNPVLTAYPPTTTKPSTTKPTPTATTKRTTVTTTAVTFRNQCVPFNTGGCPSTQNDDGFLGIVDSTDPSSCEHICRTYVHGECRSIVFQPFDLENPTSEGTCEMWRYTTEEYHGLCTWNSGPKSGDPQCLRLYYHNYSPCEVQKENF